MSGAEHPEPAPPGRTMRDDAMDTSKKYHRDGARGWFKQLWYAVSVASQLGFEIVLPPVLLMMLGRWIDTKFGSPPLFTIAGGLLGLLAAFYQARAMMTGLIGKKEDHDR